VSTDPVGLTQGSLIRDSEIRSWIYRHFVDTGRAPSPVEIAAHFQLTPADVEHRLRRLQEEANALVLLPGSSYIWMAEPFSAVPTSFHVRSGGRQGWGNCIWGAALEALWYDDRLSPAWRRRTIPERQAILDAVELTGPFWRLSDS
jgi:hypothetical protein